MRSRALINRGLTPIFCALLVACGSAPKRSVYYQDDGPPDGVAVGQLATGDATPRVEPLHPRANRPYTALGRSYTPLTADVPFRQRGMASWYGRQFHGNRTASGEIYDMYAMTAAHPTLPLPSYVRVTNPRSGASVIVRVNDRGPFKDSRVIDLSYAAAVRLGIAGAGTSEVEVERLTNAQIASGEWRQGASQVASASMAPVATTITPTAAAVPAAPAPAPPVEVPANAARWSVQLGAFTQQANADAFAARVAALLGLADDLAESLRTPRIERDQDLFRVLVGALSDRASALAAAEQLERLLGRPTSLLAR
jgi:rare lipoprotein A